MTNIMLTGFPRVGKTTAIMRFLEKTKKKCSGFYTEEIKNQYGRREGFKIVGISTGEVGTLAHINVKSFRKVGKYYVDFEGFEAVALPEMEMEKKVDNAKPEYWKRFGNDNKKRRRELRRIAEKKK